MSPHARAWVYQSNRELTTAEAENLKAAADTFVTGWTAHNHQLSAVAEIYYSRFLVLFVDEGQGSASGCSIDKSVKFIKDMEVQFGVSFLDRMNLAYKKGSQVFSLPKSEFEKLMISGEINDDTIVFNNLITTKEEFDTNWEIPLGRSWHKSLA